jgi:hypothetical protein
MNDQTLAEITGDDLMAEPLTVEDTNAIRRSRDYLHVHVRTHGPGAPIAVIDESALPGGHRWELLPSDLGRAFTAANRHITVDGMQALRQIETERETARETAREWGHRFVDGTAGPDESREAALERAARFKPGFVEIVHRDRPDAEWQRADYQPHVPSERLDRLADHVARIRALNDWRGQRLVELGQHPNPPKAYRATEVPS